MSAFLSLPFSRRRHDAVLWAALALSLVLHALVLSGWLPLRLPQSNMTLGNPDLGKFGSRSLPLAVRLATPPAPSAPPLEEAVPPQPPAVRSRAVPQAAPAPRGAPRVLLAERAPAAAATLPPADAARRGPGGAFLADLAARRRARGDAPPPPPAPQPSPGGAPAALSFGSAVGPGGEWRDGGIFRIERLTPVDGTLVFYRSNHDVQRVEVEIGSNLSIQLAVVRAVIAVMRESGFTGDVNWMSDRLGRVVEISARPADSVKLEAFLLTEFFPADPMRRPRDSADSRR
ncbi:MAG TPA: hypothetical protein VET66_06940 [Steroidobacteraceae bacterium]|nr:hypothetical protein [Steroidobacteraceae bacterium]